MSNWYTQKMVQDQLVQYLKAQLAAGVSRDALLAALKDAGWEQKDIDDSLAAAAARGIILSPSTAAAAGQARKTVAVSELYGELAGKSEAVAAKGQIKAPAGVGGGSATPLQGNMKESTERHSALKVLFVVLLIALTAGATGESAYFFLRLRSLQGNMEVSKQNLDALLAQLNGIKAEAGKVPSLQSRISELEKQAAGLAAERDVLQQEKGMLEASSTALTDSNKKLTDDNEKLRTDVREFSSEISFLVTPQGASASAQIAVVLTGALAVDTKGVYGFTTAHGVKVTIKNSRDAKVSAALSPLVGSTIELEGTHAALSKEVTAVSVNGAKIQ